MIYSSDYALTSGTLSANTLEFQRFLNDSENEVAILDSLTYTFGFFEIKPGTKLIAAKAVINCDPALASSLPLMRGRSGVRMEGVSVVGLGPSSSRSVELCYFSGERDVKISDCKFGNTAYMALTLGAAFNCRVVDNEFYGCGKAEETVEGGPALWIGPVGTTQSSDIWVERNNIHDCEWAGAYLTGSGIHANHNSIRWCKEAGFFGALTKSELTGNIINRISRKHISASGIEIGGFGVTISGGSIDYVSASNIALTDTQQVTISGVSMMSQRMEPTYYPQGSGISIITTNSAPSQPKWITVIGNTMTGFNSPWAFVDIGGTGAAVDYIRIQENNCAGLTFASGSVVKVQAGKQGAGCSFQ